ncbi:hypothetical protein F7Q99_23495 [Streptomyces kaniharaensis]|uniref:ABM domain-containing protein n=1 Tax=Streptomyces kaniharaensis TaxID=212423 RepID=A0A6N7KY20_9ACTN|nr:hypothetical protein [Streptomyces kaniharaensis]MQS15148.1 hypothetical protein [Streptomyces kaniharaensis]
MAIIVTFDLPGVTQGQYDGVIERLTDGGGFRKPSDLPVPGILTHAAGPTADGWHVTDVWESREAFDRFTEVLMPILVEVGIPTDPPRIFEAHNVVS